MLVEIWDIRLCPSFRKLFSFLHKPEWRERTFSIFFLTFSILMATRKIISEPKSGKIAIEEKNQVLPVPMKNWVSADINMKNWTTINIIHWTPAELKTKYAHRSIYKYRTPAKLLERTQHTLRTNQEAQENKWKNLLSGKSLSKQKGTNSLHINTVNLVNWRISKRLKIMTGIYGGKFVSVETPREEYIIKWRERISRKQLWF